MTIKRADALEQQLEQLADRICVEHKEAMQSPRTSLRHAIRAGEWLIKAKDLLPRGQWLPWLEANCPGISDRTAQVYMRLGH
jgi:hypothetical protein